MGLPAANWKVRCSFQICGIPSSSLVTLSYLSLIDGILLMRTVRGRVLFSFAVCPSPFLGSLVAC